MSPKLVYSVQDNAFLTAISPKNFHYSLKNKRVFREDVLKDAVYPFTTPVFALDRIMKITGHEEVDETIALLQKSSSRIMPGFEFNGVDYLISNRVRYDKTIYILFRHDHNTNEIEVYSSDIVLHQYKYDRETIILRNTLESLLDAIEQELEIGD
jgi:hypothetical protein